MISGHSEFVQKADVGSHNPITEGHKDYCGEGLVLAVSWEFRVAVCGESLVLVLS